MQIKKYTLPEENGHIISFSEYGNPSGPAILSFHGGPGSKSKPYHAERFDLTKYRVILFDQRGCGQSAPLGKIENNTTEDLLNDAERIRKFLNIDKWFVSGSSWGSAMSLLYAIKFPQNVLGILISAVFLADRDSVSWSMSNENGVAKLMPDVWEKRMEFFKKFNIKIESQNEDILKLLTTGDMQTQKEVAVGVGNWEGNLFSVNSAMEYSDVENIKEENIASAKIFVHYEANNEFISDNFILDNVSKIENIPTVIVHGRYDILCPLQKAHLLQAKQKNSELIIATSSGHKLTAEGETILKMAYDRFLEKNSK